MTNEILIKNDSYDYFNLHQVFFSLSEIVSWFFFWLFFIIMWSRSERTGIQLRFQRASELLFPWVLSFMTAKYSYNCFLNGSEYHSEWCSSQWESYWLTIPHLIVYSHLQEGSQWRQLSSHSIWWMHCGISVSLVRTAIEWSLPNYSWKTPLTRHLIMDAQ